MNLAILIIASKQGTQGRDTYELAGETSSEKSHLDSSLLENTQRRNEYFCQQISYPLPR